MGNEAADAAAAAAAAQQQQGAVPEWHAHLTDELKADPVVANWVKTASEKDLPSIIKGYAHSTKRMGSAINLPGKDAKPEEVQALRAKLYEAGVFTAPPSKVEDYKIAKPDKLPDGIGWNDDFAKKFGETMLKHGVPLAAVPDILALHEEILVGAGKALKTSYDTGIATLKTEFGDKYDERRELATRILPAIFKTPEELAFMEEMGLADHPGFMGVIMRLAPLAAQDSSFMAQAAREGGQMTGDDVLKEVKDIRENKDNPRHAGYWNNDKSVMAYVDELYRKAYGTKQVDVSSGVPVGAGK
jgi:hypothetical protein